MGDVIEVTLNIVVPSSLHYVVVEDPLPAGCEAVDVTLNTTSVVGEQPVLEPGESFEYTSFCPLPTPIGSMHGTYQMVTAGGSTFDAEIAPFSLAVPSALN